MKSFLQSQIGLLFGLCFCIATALSTTLIHQTNTNFNPFFSLFCTTLIGILYFHVIKIQNIRTMYHAACSEKKLWCIISIMVTGNWIATFYTLSKINPFVYIYTYYSTSAIIGAVAQYAKHKKNTTGWTAVVLTMLLIIFFKHLLVTTVKARVLIVGLLVAIISAGFGYSYRHFSVQFSQKTKLDAASVLTLRFYLLLIVSLLCSHSADFSLFTPHQALFFAGLSAITFLIPLYCMQNSVLLIGADYFSILSGLCPAMSAVLLLYFDKTAVHFYFILSFALFGVILTKTLITLFANFRQRKQVTA